MKQKLMALVLCGVLLSGCATPYQRPPNRLKSISQFFLTGGIVDGSGGYTETQLGENIYKVSFSGNNYTSFNKAADLSLLRVAEIGIKKGFTYFILIDNKDIVSKSKSYRPSATNTASYFKRKPKNVNNVIYDVHFVFDSISKKYNIETSKLSGGKVN